MTGKATIMDVAREAGVSSSTVSHAISGKRPISPEVRARIKGVIERLGYRPNQAAKSLVSKRSMQIGVITDEISNSISGVLLEAIGQRLRERGYKILLGVCDWKKEIALDYLREFSSGMADGVINMVGGVGANEAYKECRGVPVVTYLRPSSSPVYMDKIGGAFLALEHLWSLGHRRIGFISTKPSLVPELVQEERELGYRQFFVKRGLEADERLIVPGDDSPASGYAGAERLYAAGATAIFSANDMMAVGVLQWAQEKGVKVPDALSVVGFDDAPVAAAVAPPLTTVQMPVAELAEKTVAGLLLLMDGRAFGQTEMLQTRLVVRGSSAKPSSHNVESKEAGAK